LQLGKDGFIVPDRPPLDGRTVFLQFTVKSSLAGWFFDPCIEFTYGTSEHRQYFERGARGQRYLNISPLFQSKQQPAAGHRIGLHGLLLRWERSGLLLAYDSPAIEQAEILVLAPHPDDAEIAAYGVYCGRKSWVVTITAGDKATANLPPNISPAARAHWTASLRVGDSLTIPQLGQVPADRCVNLVYPDGALGAMYREPSRPFQLSCQDSLDRAELLARNHAAQFRAGNSECTWDGLVGDLRSLLLSSRPDIIICPHPCIDSHSDHVYTTLALERAMRDISSKRPLVFLYVVHVRGAPAYPLGPADSLVCLPPGRFEANMADSIYSHPLAESVRQAKFFAVAANHATRNAGSKLMDSRGPVSFLRRAPRANEIYFVVSAEGLRELAERVTGDKRNSSERL
jgi:LmbE family N-acetylglucosaminyl deacetylase